MKKLLLFLLLTGTITYAQPNIGDPENLNSCADNFDGFAYFDLTLNNTVLLQGQDPSDFVITYHETYSGAQTEDTVITVPQSYHSINGVVYARVTEVADPSSYAVTAFALIVSPRPDIPLIPVQYVLDNDIPSDGLAVIDLTLLNDISLGGASPDEMEITYYTTAEDALSGSNPIVNSNTYSTPSATLYVRLETTISSCVSIAPFTVVVNDFETGTPEDIYACDENNDGYALFDLTLNTDTILNGLNTDNYAITYYETVEFATSGTNEISNPTGYTNINQSSQVIYYKVTETTNPESYVTSSFSINTSPSPFSSLTNLYFLDNNDNNAQDLTINLLYTDILATIAAYNAGPQFEVTLYNDAAHNSVITTDFTVTTSAVVYYSIENTESGCVTNGQTTLTVLPGDYVTPPPTGESIQGLLINQTLADLIVEGENILWYATDGTGAFPGGTETPLPNDTPLTDGNTYYATQTLNNIESIERLAVTVYDVLNTQDVVFIELIYYPNPVTDVLNIKNTNEIGNVTVINTLGQTIFTNKVNSTESNISFSHLSSGIYFVNVTSEGKSKTLKIIKK